MILRPGRRQHSMLDHLNPFVVFTDVTISVILCLTVALGLMAADRPSGDWRAEYLKLQREHEELRTEYAVFVQHHEREVAALKKEVERLRRLAEAKDTSHVPREIVARQKEVRHALLGLRGHVVDTFDSQVVRFDEAVLFDSGRSVLRNEGQAALADFASRLGPLLRTADEGEPGRILEVQVQGHTDATGDYALNLKLGRDRAEVVRDWLFRQGLPGKYLSVAAYAWHRPIKPGAKGQDVPQNRRIDVRLIFQRPDITGEQPTLPPEY